MKKTKWLSAKAIVIYLIIIIIGILLLTYTVKGLKVAGLDSEMIEFDLTTYTNYYDYDENGKYTGTDTTVAHPDLNTHRAVAQNDKYTMYLNEMTTVVSVAVNETMVDTGTKDSNGFEVYEENSDSIVYQTSLDAEYNDTSLLSQQRSLFIMDYIDGDGKNPASTYNTFANSVHYENKLRNCYERHYYVKFTDDGCQICYRLGNFVVLTSFFPTYWNREDFEETFRGNTVFYVNITQPDGLSGNPIMAYTGVGKTWSKEAAEYLDSLGIGTVTEKVMTDSLGLSSFTYWELTGFADSEGHLKLTANVDYNASQGWTYNEETETYEQTGGYSPVTTNPFINSKAWADLTGTNGYSLIQSLDSDDTALSSQGYSQYDVSNERYYANASPTYKFDASSATSTFCQKIYNYLYNTNDTNYYLYLGNTHATLDVDGNPVKVGGYQLRDENGNFVYNEDGSAARNDVTTHTAILKDEAEHQNSIYNQSVSSYPDVYQVAFDFTLDESGYNINIIGNSLREGAGSGVTETLADGTVDTTFSHDYRFHTFTLFPYQTIDDGSPVNAKGEATSISNGDAVKMTSEGIIVLPDGSGAVMSFNSVKDDLNVSAVSKRIYGTDWTDVDTLDTSSGEYFSMAMYGFLAKTQKKGWLVACTQGASQLSLAASFIRKSTLYTVTQYNRAYFTLELRASKSLAIGTSKSTFTQWQKSFANDDYKFKIELLDEDEFVESDGTIEYVTLAQRYKQLLENQYPNLKTKTDTTDTNTVTVRFLGAIEKRNLFLGFPYNKDTALTTFDEAQEILSMLTERGVTNINVAYSGWTTDGMAQELRSVVNASSALGGNSDLKSLISYLKENNMDFYPEYQIASVYGFGSATWGANKYASKTVTSEYVKHFEFNLATHVSDKTTSATTMISPRFYKAIMNNFLGSFKKYNSTGVWFSDLGSMSVGDYAKKVSIYSSEGALYQSEVLAQATSTYKAMLSAPFDYAYQYATNVVDLPTESTLLPCYDYSIPLVQLVCSGWFDYSADAVNMDSEHSTNYYLLKALETGSNLYFNLTYENTTILLDTDYTKYFNAYYANWLADIIEMNAEINASGIQKGTLASHKAIADNVYEVTYNKKGTNQVALKLIINYNDSNYYDTKTGFSVKANWYTVVENNL